MPTLFSLRTATRIRCTMSKFTPGPWAVEKGTNFVNGPSGYDVCQVFEDPAAEINRAQAAANQRLIASAPDLLESLVWAIDILEKQAHGNPERMADIHCAKQAITKATGES